MKTKKAKTKSKKTPLVVIVIVNWNGGEKIINCLKSLKMTSYKNYKVILVDNGSKDDSVERLKKINRKMKILGLPKNYGYTIAENIGWEHAINKMKADYVCAMDSDIVTIQKDWLDLQIKETLKLRYNQLHQYYLMKQKNNLVQLVQLKKLNLKQRKNWRNYRTKLNLKKIQF